jgi:hypothetical protein
VREWNTSVVLTGKKAVYEERARTRAREDTLAEDSTNILADNARLFVENLSSFREFTPKTLPSHLMTVFGDVPGVVGMKEIIMIRQKSGDPRAPWHNRQAIITFGSAEDAAEARFALNGMDPDTKGLYGHKPYFKWAIQKPDYEDRSDRRMPKRGGFRDEGGAW